MLRVVAARSADGELLVELPNGREAVTVLLDDADRPVVVSKPLFIPSWLARGYWRDLTGVSADRIAAALAVVRART